MGRIEVLGVVVLLDGCVCIVTELSLAWMRRRSVLGTGEEEGLCWKRADVGGAG